MSTKFICLANSFKEGGRCLAGIEVDANDNPVIINGKPKWIRPVCNTLHGEIPNHIAEPFKILDIVEITITGTKPEGYQSENVTFNTGSLMKAGSFDLKQVKNLCESGKYVFATRYDYLSEEVIANLNHSLVLIIPKTFEVIERPNYQYPDRPKQRLVFSYNDFTYDFSITDPAFLRKYQKNPDFFEDIEEIVLSLSVGVKFPVTNRYYKLVAGIIY
jgi:hypothetical protein